MVFATMWAAMALGMAVEYSVQGERAGENRASWRVGVTYR